MEVLNWRLLTHPMNWVVVFLMVLIAALAIHLIFGFNVKSPLGKATA